MLDLEGTLVLHWAELWGLCAQRLGGGEWRRKWHLKEEKEVARGVLLSKCGEGGRTPDSESIAVDLS